MLNTKGEMVEFNKAYALLNSTQKEAVDTIDGPVMVIAGPGTGKTQILTLRIANILRLTDTKPENILALTFTESGVRAMRSRLAKFIGVTAYRVPIHTFHSFAGEMIKLYPDSYEHIVGGRPASDLEKIILIEELLNNGNFRRLRPHGDPSYYVKPILDAISTLKKENISPTDLATAISDQEKKLLLVPKMHEKGAHKGKVRGEYLEAEKSLDKNKELLYLYKLYVAGLRTSRVFDFEDMILDTIAALTNNQEMLFDVQERYQYILADEHQDVNQSQNRLIELISAYHSSPNVFVVGDEKQAIYRFQGASLDNFLYFGDIYKHPKTIALTLNYRSGQQILDLAYECIKTEDPTLKELRVPLRAKNNTAVTVERREFSHSPIEESWVIDQIKKYHEAGVVLNEIAIIVRTNREVELFANLLRKENIAVSASAETDILRHPITRSILNLLRVVAYPENDVDLIELLHAPYLGISSSDLVKFLQARDYSKNLEEMLGDETMLQTIGVGNPASFLELVSLINAARELAVIKNPAEVAEFILKQSGLIDHILKQDILDGTGIIRRLYDEIERMYAANEVTTLKNVLEKLLLLSSYNLPLLAPFLSTKENAVQVMTAHKAKGLEFEVVMIPHVTDNAWGIGGRGGLFQLPVVKHTTPDSKSLAEDDERRLFYVAITRAKRVLHFSYSVMNTEGREFNQSRFLANFTEPTIFNGDTSQFASKFTPVSLIRPVTPTTLSTDFLHQALVARGWSATSFNNYQKSPWEYIYKNALRVPTIKTPELQFGSAIHKVLEKVVAHISKNNTSPSNTEVQNWLTSALGRVPTVEEFTRQHRRGFEALMAYLPHLTASLPKTIKTEYSVKAMLPTGLVDFPEVLLTGNFDRLDFNQTGDIWRVVDYKTGKIKTRGEIEGLTKNSTGAYKRQLVFYALLLSLQADERLHTKTGILSFIEPDKKGLIHEEEFSISEEEIELLKQDLIKATRAVISGDCLKEPCDPDHCNFCHLAENLH